MLLLGGINLLNKFYNLKFLFLIIGGKINCKCSILTKKWQIGWEGRLEGDSSSQIEVIIRVAMEKEKTRKIREVHTCFLFHLCVYV